MSSSFLRLIIPSITPKAYWLALVRNGRVYFMPEGRGIGAEGGVGDTGEAERNIPSAER